MRDKYIKAISFVLGIAILLSISTGIWLHYNNSTERSSAIGGVDIAPNTTVPTSPPFHLVGEIHYTFSPSQRDDSSFEDVMLCFYDSQNQVIRSENLGTFDGAAKTVAVNITTSRVPSIIIVHHPEFYTIDGFQNEGMEYVDSIDQFRMTSLRDPRFDLRQLEQGSCTLPS